MRIICDDFFSLAVNYLRTPNFQPLAIMRMTMMMGIVLTMCRLLVPRGKVYLILFLECPPSKHRADTMCSTSQSQSATLKLCGGLTSQVPVRMTNILLFAPTTSTQFGGGGNEGEMWVYGTSLGGSLCNTFKMKMLVGRVRLTSHESESTQKARIT